MARKLTIAFVTAALILGGAAGWAIARTDHHPAPMPRVALGSWQGIKPSIVYFSGDSGNVVSKIVWKSWGGGSASGTGAWGYNNCVPNCAEGKVVDYPATITLSAPVGRFFTRLVERQSGPHGRTYVFKLPAPYLSAGS